MPPDVGVSPGVVESHDALSARLSFRQGANSASTSGIAPTYIQANLLVLPSRYADDFRRLCQRNPVPCPLLAESRAVGNFHDLKSHMAGLGDDDLCQALDLRRDLPKYMVYKDGALVRSQCADIVDEWTEDHIAFLIGCSFSFESALADAHLPPRHAVLRRNVSIYRTNIPLCPFGVFTGGTYVVSMRPYAKSQIDTVRAVARPYMSMHGEPIAWGWDAVRTLGIDIDRPDWGDAPLTLDGRPLGDVTGDEDNVPVFWGCGVTPQDAVLQAPDLKGTIMAHAPGYMLIMDVRNWHITGKQ
ncbi:MAG: hypothetical protein M1818_001548 [Claussenomyces sp. TS43310]|nr:MAG: hypothetical protein M1818_001548 [Claussenomyces sp. TS43310]